MARILPFLSSELPAAGGDGATTGVTPGVTPTLDLFPDLAPSAQAPLAAPVRATNAAIAHALDRAADMLSEREANEHRVGAYRRAAETVRAHDAPLVEMVEAGGAAALEALPGIGERLAARIAAFVHTGELALLRELREAVTPARLFERLPGVGRVLGRQIAEATGADSLEALEVAAYDGRLAAMPGMGPRRLAALRATLDARLAGHTRRDARRARSAVRASGAPEPSVVDILSIDAEYRDHARRGLLPTVAPRRFNPSGEAWLPVLETRRGPWRFTALFSNTPRAHELEKTSDWVVVYYETSDRREHTATVVTEARGALRGRRVVRGREADCRDAYAFDGRQAA